MDAVAGIAMMVAIIFSAPLALLVGGWFRVRSAAKSSRKISQPTWGAESEEGQP